MSESRKRKLDPEGEQYRQELAMKDQRLKRMRQSRALTKEVNTDLSDLFGDMKASEQVPAAAAMDVDMDMAARGRSRKTRKASKKMRKTKKKSKKARKH